MFKILKPSRIAQTTSTEITKESRHLDSRYNPEGTLRTVAKTRQKTRKFSTDDSRDIGDKRLRKELKKIKLNVGWLRAIALKHRGRVDGRLGQPRPNKNELWISPFIAKEQHTAETYMSQRWAEHELTVFRKQEEVQKLNLEIADAETSIARKFKEEPAKPTEEELSKVLVQEQNSSPAMIRTRRMNEWKKNTAGYYSSLASIQKKLDDLKIRRAELMATVEESACVIRLLCEKKRDLHRQRVDIYYHGVIKTHPNRKDMPPVPEFLWENFAENLYDRLHETQEQGGIA